MDNKLSTIEARIRFITACLLLVALMGVFIAVLSQRGTITSLWWIALVPVLLSALGVWAYWWIVLPYRRTKHILRLFSTGYTYRSIVDDKVPINDELVAVNAVLQQLLNTDQLMNASKRQAQFLALQNQINPHFLYNTLEGIRSEALLAGLGSVATMTEALSTFFRYTISGVENLVTLKEEIENTKNYFLIQQFRFGTRIKLRIITDGVDEEEILRCRMPKLTLQPIVENSIVHGLECKGGEGTLTLRLEESRERLFITVQDDGVGMATAVLSSIQRNLSTRSFDYVKRDEQQGGIALINVNNRIKILFGEQYGLTVTSQPGVGTDVMISLPRSIADGSEA